MNRPPQKTLAAHRWPVAASLCGEPPESTQRVFPPQPPPVKRKKARWQAGFLVKHFSSNNTRLVGLLIAASVTSGAGVAMVFLLVMRLIGGAS